MRGAFVRAGLLAVVLASCTINVNPTPPTPTATPTADNTENDDATVPTETNEADAVNSLGNCERHIARYSTEPPDIAALSGVATGNPDRAAIREAANAAIGWTRIIAKTYQCISDHGALERGDAVLALYASAVELVWVRFENDEDKATISTAMQGILDLYETSCLDRAAHVWFRKEHIPSETLAPCISF